MFSVKEAANKLGISRSKLYQLAERREIAHYRIGGKLLFSQEQLQDFLSRCRIDTVKAPPVLPSPRIPKLKHVRV